MQSSRPLSFVGSIVGAIVGAIVGFIAGSNAVSSSAAPCVRASILMLLLVSCGTRAPESESESDAASATRSARTVSEAYPHADEPIGALRDIYNGILSPELAANTFRNIDRLLPVRQVPASLHPQPLPLDTVNFGTWSFTDGGQRYTIDDYLERNRVAGLLIVQNGHIRMERYRLGNSPRTRWMSMSVAKSITSTLVGAAVRDGFIGSLDDSVTHYVPALVGSAYAGVSVRDVLTMTSGVRWSETYTDPTSDRRRLLDAQLTLTPGSAMALMGALPRAAPPGTVNRYSTGETQVMAEVLRGALKRPLSDYLAERIWQPFGMEADAYWWLESPDGVEIGGSGFSATLRDYGRFGLFVLRDGVIAGDSVLPAGWVREATSPHQLKNGKIIEYGYLWWTADAPADVRDHAFTAEGIHGQFLYVNPARNLVMVVWQANPKPVGGGGVDDRAFFRSVAAYLAAREAIPPNS